MISTGPTLDVYRHAYPQRQLAVIAAFGSAEPRQTMYPITARHELAERYRGQADVAMSVSAYGWKRTRALSNMAELTGLHLDCEIHKGRYRDFRPEGLVTVVLQHCSAIGIPIPSEIVFSGRGAHIYWVFAKPVPHAAYVRWYRVQQALADRFTPFHPDRGALDGARVLRMVGTVNSRSGETARVLWQSVDDDWCFEELTRNILPIPREEIRTNRAERVAAKEGAATGNRPAGLWTKRQRYWNLYLDLRKLAHLRGGTIPEGYRHNFLRFTGCSLAYGGNVTDRQSIETEIVALGKELTPTLPLTDMQSFARLYAGAVASGRIITLGNDTIIDVLDVSADERRHLTWLRTSDERKARRRQLDRERKNAQMDRETYQGEAAARRERALVLRSEGLTRKQIAQELEVTVHTVASYLRSSSGPEGECVRRELVQGREDRSYAPLPAWNTLHTPAAQVEGC